jgi:hypothetical protein
MRVAVIEEKVDTARKLIAAEGKPTNEFLFAAEVNRFSALIRLLLSNLNLNAVNAEFVNDLGDITGATVVDTINTGALTAYASPSYVKYIIDDISYTDAFTGPAGNYGTGGLQCTAQMFLTLESSEDVAVVSNSKEIIMTVEFLGFEVTDYEITKNTTGATIDEPFIDDENVLIFPLSGAYAGVLKNHSVSRERSGTANIWYRNTIDGYQIVIFQQGDLSGPSQKIYFKLEF